jgi:site-specific DNA-cytosine methylase
MPVIKKITKRSGGGLAPIRVGEDCAGLMGASVALRKLGLGDRIKHVYTSESCQKVRRVMKLNWKELGPIGKDIMRRSPLEKCDVYSCGFPCQGFSSQGKRLGMFDPSGRGLIGMAACKAIADSLPKAFILENVGSFGDARYKQFRDGMLTALRNICDANGHIMYDVRTRKLNSRFHGVPQNRERYYIVGTANKYTRLTGIQFQWPMDLPCAGDLEDFLDPRPSGRNLDHDICIPTGKVAQANLLQAVLDLTKRKEAPLENPWVAEIFGGRGPRVKYNYSPCLTSERCRIGGHYLLGRGRLMSTAEMLRLQGHGIATSAGGHGPSYVLCVHCCVLFLESRSGR